MLVIRAWLSNIETDPQKVDDALKALIEQQKADPTNSDVALYVALRFRKGPTPMPILAGAPRAKCHVCRRRQVAGGRDQGTGGQRRHALARVAVLSH